MSPQIIFRGVYAFVQYSNYEGKGGEMMGPNHLVPISGNQMCPSTS